MSKLVTSSIISALIIFACCNNYSQLNSDIDNKPDTSKPFITTSFKGTTFPAIFEAAFYIDTKVLQGDFHYSFYNYDIGKIRIESGKIIACDPIVMDDTSPFTQMFPIGEFPVHLAMAKTYNDERVAFSRIVFSVNPIFKWEFALQKDQKPISLKDSNYYCYGVDAGTGIFIDSISNIRFNQQPRSEWDNVFITKAEKNGYKGYIHDFEGTNLATFSTGYGDGCYATYIGFDIEGKVCQLLTDFEIVEWSKLEENK